LRDDISIRADRRTDAPPDPDDLLWRQFDEATGPEAFARTWLTLQCRMIPNVSSGVLVLKGPEPGRFVPAALWPDGRRARPHLGQVAERALQQRRAVSVPVPQPQSETEPMASPRMRYDLVVNTFVKDALDGGTLHVFYGGEMWRPLIDVKDVARAYVIALECDAELIRGQVYNLARENFRISELALRSQLALRAIGVPAELDADYAPRMIRSYRISSEKVEKTLGFRSQVSVEESIGHMVKEIRARGLTDFTHPRYYNIEWMKLLEESVQIVSRHGYVLSKPGWQDRGGERSPTEGG